MPQLSTPRLSTEQAHESRIAVAIVAAAFATFLALVLAAHLLDWIEFRIEIVAWICVGLVALNLGLSVAAPRWLHWRWAVYWYEGFHALMLTVLLHFLGGSQMSILVILYAFVVLHTEMLRSDASVSITANFCAFCYAGLMWLEATGVLTVRRILDVRLTSGQQIGYVLVTGLALNFLALYAQRYGRQLRHLAARLQDMVAAQTAELHAVNTELATNAKALETKQRDLEAKQEELKFFVYSTTHDLKSPFNGILLTASVLLESARGSLDPETREDLEQIVRSASLGENMLRDLLRLFEVTSSREEPSAVDLRALVLESLDTLRPRMLERGVHVDVGLLPSVWGRRAKLSHVITNLLDNAIKYVPLGHGEVAISAQRRDGQITLRVCDNGIGIPSDYHRRVFEIFGRGPTPPDVNGNAVPSSGVGLALVKRIVEEHHGAVWLESAPGLGSTFFVRLPAIDNRP